MKYHVTVGGGPSPIYHVAVEAFDEAGARRKIKGKTSAFSDLPVVSVKLASECDSARHRIDENV